MYLVKTETERGFQIIQFQDCYNQNCSLQQSSNMKKQVLLGAEDLSYDEKDLPYNSKISLGRKESLKLAIRLLIFSISGRLFHSSKKKEQKTFSL